MSAEMSDKTMLYVWRGVSTPRLIELIAESPDADTKRRRERVLQLRETRAERKKEINAALIASIGTRCGALAEPEPSAQAAETVDRNSRDESQ